MEKGKHQSVLFTDRNTEKVQGVQETSSGPWSGAPCLPVYSSRGSHGPALFHVSISFTSSQVTDKVTDRDTSCLRMCQQQPVTQSLLFLQRFLVDTKLISAACIVQAAGEKSILAKFLETCYLRN